MSNLQNVSDDSIDWMFSTPTAHTRSAPLENPTFAEYFRWLLANPRDPSLRYQRLPFSHVIFEGLPQDPSDTRPQWVKDLELPECPVEVFNLCSEAQRGQTNFSRYTVFRNDSDTSSRYSASSTSFKEGIPLFQAATQNREFHGACPNTPRNIASQGPARPLSRKEVIKRVKGHQAHPRERAARVYTYNHKQDIVRESIERGQLEDEEGDDQSLMPVSYAVFDVDDEGEDFRFAASIAIPRYLRGSNVNTSANTTIEETSYEHQRRFLAHYEAKAKRQQTQQQKKPSQRPVTSSCCPAKRSRKDVEDEEPDSESSLQNSKRMNGEIVPNAKAIRRQAPIQGGTSTSQTHFQLATDSAHFAQQQDEEPAIDLECMRTRSGTSQSLVDDGGLYNASHEVLGPESLRYHRGSPGPSQPRENVTSGTGHNPTSQVTISAQYEPSEAKYLPVFSKDELRRQVDQIRNQGKKAGNSTTIQAMYTLEDVASPFCAQTSQTHSPRTDPSRGSNAQLLNMSAAPKKDSKPKPKRDAAPKKTDRIANPKESVPKKKKNGPWTDYEYQMLDKGLKARRAFEEENEEEPRLRDVAFWKKVMESLHGEGFPTHRTHTAARLFWSRGGRARSGFDERFIKSDVLITCTQGKKKKTATQNPKKKMITGQNSKSTKNKHRENAEEEGTDEDNADEGDNQERNVQEYATHWDDSQSGVK